MTDTAWFQVYVSGEPYGIYEAGNAVSALSAYARDIGLRDFTDLCDEIINETVTVKYYTIPPTESFMAASDLFPKGQRLQRFFEHYCECQECGPLPTDADDLRSGELCGKGSETYLAMSLDHRHGMAQLALLHILKGAELHEAGATLPDKPGPRLVRDE